MTLHKTQDTEKQDYTSQSMEHGTPKSRNACLKCLMPNELLNDIISRHSKKNHMSLFHWHLAVELKDSEAFHDAIFQLSLCFFFVIATGSTTIELVTPEPLLKSHCL
jgi:hypothetical protein